MHANDSVMRGLTEALAFAQGKDSEADVHYVEILGVDVASMRAQTGLARWRHRASKDDVARNQGSGDRIMAIETKVWDAAEVLNTPADIAAYLDAYLEDGSPEEMLQALKTIARSHGMSALARETGISREALYRAFSDKGNPTLETLLRVMKALGLRLAIAA